MNKLLKIIKEEVENLITKINSHSQRRLNQRLDRMTNEGDITQNENSRIRKTLDDVLAYTFNPNKSYGILLGTFIPNPESTLFTKTNKINPGVPFYEIYAEDENDIITDSTGDEFWGIIRNNEITTVMLRKRLQREFAKNERGERGGLGVTDVIMNFDDYKKRVEDEKQAQQQREIDRQKAEDNTMKINGVQWIIDRDKEHMYKKNKPNVIVAFNDVLEYPEWDDKTQDEIMNRIYP